MAVDRGCYIDQSQSLNIHMDQPNFGKLTSLHFHAWSKVSTLVLHKFEIWNQMKMYYVCDECFHDVGGCY